MSKTIPNELETVYLRLRRTEVDGVAVIKFRVNDVLELIVYRRWA